VLRFFIILVSFLAWGVKASCQDELLSGLRFSSHEVVQDKRTSLNLTPDNSYRFPDGFTIEMEANFRHGDGHYGYIFRIIGDGRTNIDLISNLASPSSNFWLVFKDKVLFSYKWSDINNGDFDQWIKIKVEIDAKSNKLSVWMNGNKQEQIVHEIGSLKNFDIVFGACRNSLFYNTDVCPMSLKDIKIFNSKKKLTHEWKLSQHSQSRVYDEINHREATIENPIWIIDKHIKWRKQIDLMFDNLVGIAADDENGKVFFVDKKAVYILLPETYQIDTIPFVGGLPYFELSKQLIYNKFTNELWSYNFYKNEISKFSFLTRKWSSSDSRTIEPDYWHHNKLISPVDSSLLTLFGYGHYKYKSDINKYDNKSKSWKKIDNTNQIQPRYMSSAGLLNNKEVLVFGGYGSKTGRQELSPEFYYDLYILNLKDFSFKKVWTLEKPEYPFVPCEALIPDQPEGCFYTLVYSSVNFSTSLHLAKFGIDKNEYQIYNDSIPYNFLDTESWSTLFLNKKMSQLVAITSHLSEVSLYTIAYPPLLPSDVYQKEPKKMNWILMTVLILGAATLTTGGFLVTRRKKIKKNSNNWYVKIDHPCILPIEEEEKRTISSIYLIGVFQVFDKKGSDITSSFSPTLKQLFLYIFLHSSKNGKGVLSSKLDEVLWYDKSEESARNNRNVNISKLRLILDEIEGIEIINENSYWKIYLDKTIFCDYTLVLDLLKKSSSMNLSETEIKQILSLLLSGELLPQIQTDWMDEIKSQFANEVIDVLSSLSKEKEIINNFSIQYHLAECILLYDRFNDEAFASKCSVLYHIGKKGTAKNMYDSFCRDYKQSLGIEYEVQFNELIKQKS
jgi:two-component SAPR family response regulator